VFVLVYSDDDGVHDYNVLRVRVLRPLPLRRVNGRFHRVRGDDDGDGGHGRGHNLLRVHGDGRGRGRTLLRARGDDGVTFVLELWLTSGKKPLQTLFVSDEHS
jgi:hypothetical protein